MSWGIPGATSSTLLFNFMQFKKHVYIHVLSGGSRVPIFHHRPNMHNPFDQSGYSKYLMRACAGVYIYSVAVGLLLRIKIIVGIRVHVYMHNVHSFLHMWV